MKRTFGFLIAFLLLTTAAQAQKWGYVDTEYILEQLPEYKAAQEEIEQQSTKWQNDLEKMYADIEKMYRDYQEGEVLWPEDVKKKKQDEIFEAERKAKEYKKSKFGYDGELYRIQDEKIKPIQDEVLLAIDGVAKEKRLTYVFDKAANTGLVYADPRFEVTDDVLKKMGVYGGSGGGESGTKKPGTGGGR